MLERIGTQGLVVGIVGDNAANIQLAIKNLCQQHPGLVGVRCAAHSFQLLLEDICKVCFIF